LEDGNGNVIATAANASTLGQTITANVAAGKYYLFAESYGQYGDVGQYTVSGTIQPPAGSPTFAISGAASVNELSTYTPSLSASEPGHTTSNWLTTWGDGNTQTITGNPSSATHTYATGPHSYTISATATDDVSTYTAGNTVAVSVLHVTPTLTLTGNS